MVQLVANFLSNKTMDPTIPVEVWNKAVDDCYAAVCPERGRKTTFYIPRKRAKELGLNMKDTISE